MTTTPSPRYGSGLNTYTSGTDFRLSREGWNAFAATLNAMGAIVTQGVTSGRPAADANKPRRFYFATDTNILWYDQGGTWVQIAPIGGSTPTTAYPGTAGTEGTSPNAARADHAHFNPPVTFQTTSINQQTIGSGGATQTLGSAINVPAVGYPRVLEARLRGMSTAQSARVQWQIINVSTSGILKAGSATSNNQSVEVTFRELLPASTARSVQPVLVADGSANTPASGAYSDFTVTTYPAGTP